MVKDAFRISWTADLSLLLAWLNIRRLAGVWFFLPGGPGFSLCGHESLYFAGYVIGWSLGVSGWSGFLSGML